MKREIRICSDKEELGLSAGRLIYSLAESSIKKKGSFFLVLSGGKTPERLYRFLARPRPALRIEWKSVYVFWGDERYVPRDRPESNYRMAFDSLLSKVPLPAENIFPIPTQKDSVEESASAYDRTLKQFFKKRNPAGTIPPLPEFDLILLGIGKDGHTASLFPGNPLSGGRGRWVMPVEAPPGYAVHKRITMTLPSINNAIRVIFLVSGEEKREVLEKILMEKALFLEKEKTIHEEKTTSTYPARLVRPRERLILFTDIKLR